MKSAQHVYTEDHLGNWTKAIIWDKQHMLNQLTWPVWLMSLVNSLWKSITFGFPSLERTMATYKIFNFGIVLLACTILKIPSILVLRWCSCSCSYCCPPHSWVHFYSRTSEWFTASLLFLFFGFWNFTTHFMKKMAPDLDLLLLHCFTS